MKNLKCPKCQDEISFLTFVKALTPWHIRCSGCKSKLKVGKYVGVTFGLAVALGMIISYTSCYVFNIPIRYSILILLLIGIVAEYVYFTLAAELGVDLKLKE